MRGEQFNDLRGQADFGVFDFALFFVVSRFHVEILLLRTHFFQEVLAFLFELRASLHVQSHEIVLAHQPEALPDFRLHAFDFLLGQNQQFPEFFVVFESFQQANDVAEIPAGLRLIRNAKFHLSLRIVHGINALPLADKVHLFLAIRLRQ